MCVKTCPELLRGAERPGLEPAISRLEVQRPNHYTQIHKYQKEISEESTAIFKMLPRTKIKPFRFLFILQS